MINFGRFSTEVTELEGKVEERDGKTSSFILETNTPKYLC